MAPVRRSQSRSDGPPGEADEAPPNVPHQEEKEGEEHDGDASVSSTSGTGPPNENDEDRLSNDDDGNGHNGDNGGDEDDDGDCANGDDGTPSTSRSGDSSLTSLSGDDKASNAVVVQPPQGQRSRD